MSGYSGRGLTGICLVRDRGFGPGAVRGKEVFNLFVWHSTLVLILGEQLFSPKRGLLHGLGLLGRQESKRIISRHVDKEYGSCASQVSQSSLKISDVTRKPVPGKVARYPPLPRENEMIDRGLSTFSP